MSCWRIRAGKGSEETLCSPLGPRARIKREAWRGLVRVMRPRMRVLTSGRRVVEEGDMVRWIERVGQAFWDDLEDVLVGTPAPAKGPAIEAQMFWAWM